MYAGGPRACFRSHGEDAFDAFLSLKSLSQLRVSKNWSGLGISREDFDMCVF